MVASGGSETQRKCGEAALIESSGEMSANIWHQPGSIDRGENISVASVTKLMKSKRHQRSSNAIRQLAYQLIRGGMAWARTRICGAWNARAARAARGLSRRQQHQLAKIDYQLMALI